MARKKKSHSLSIVMAKKGISSADEIVTKDRCNPPQVVPFAGFEDGALYVQMRRGKPPAWSSLFREVIDLSRLPNIPGVSAVLTLKVDDRWFAVLFGQSGRFLLKDNICEERFGLICTLNAIEPDTLRSIDAQSLDALQSHFRIQVGQGAPANQFGLDIERDILKAVVGAPKDKSIGSRMAGTDTLFVAVSLDLSDLPGLIRRYKASFDSPLRGSEYEWINNLSQVKNRSTIDRLDGALVEKIRLGKLENIWLAIPQIIDWKGIAGFSFSRSRRARHSDVTIEKFLATVEDKTAIDLALLHDRKVLCLDREHQPIYQKWSVYRCTYAEIDEDQRKYVLNDGVWYSLDTDFVSRTNAEFSRIDRSGLVLPLYEAENEAEYNQSVAESDPDSYVLLDAAQKITHGGGQGQVEVCDLLHKDGILIHVKRYGKSSVLSHLFSQGSVSGTLIKTDSAFREKVLAKLKPPFNALIHRDQAPTEHSLTISYAIISSEPGVDLTLPFFSRVNLNNTVKLLKGFGYKVDLLKINVNPVHAMKIVAAPKKRRKRRLAG